MAVPKDLAAFGITEATDTIRHRLLIGTQGQDKTGKSNFWLTAPGPIGVVNLDIGLEGVVEKWAKRKQIWVRTLNVPPITNQAEYLKYWNWSREAYEKFLAHKDVRTVVIDDGSSWWELARLAEFGQLNPAADIKRAYAPLNQLFRSFIKKAYDTDKNLIITHKVKEVWTTKNVNGKLQDTWDGTYKKTGFGEDAYLIQVNLEHFFRDGQFGIRIINCRQNMSLAGFELGQAECTFANLGTMVFDGTTEKDWQ